MFCCKPFCSVHPFVSGHYEMNSIMNEPARPSASSGTLRPRLPSHSDAGVFQSQPQPQPQSTAAPPTSSTSASEGSSDIRPRDISNDRSSTTVGVSRQTRPRVCLGGVAAWACWPTVPGGVSGLSGLLPGLCVWVRVHGGVCTGWVLCCILSSASMQRASV